MPPSVAVPRQEPEGARLPRPRRRADLLTSGRPRVGRESGGIATQNRRIARRPVSGGGLSPPATKLGDGNTQAGPTALKCRSSRLRGGTPSAAVDEALFVLLGYGAMPFDVTEGGFDAHSNRDGRDRRYATPLRCQ
jgi:hypothetical protein